MDQPDPTPLTETHSDRSKTRPDLADYELSRRLSRRCAKRSARDDSSRRRRWSSKMRTSAGVAALACWAA